MHCCCSDDTSAEPPTEPPTRSGAAATSWPRRIGVLVRWAIPLVTLALIPKCPACVAAYVFLFTGIGLSFQAAAAMRWGLFVLSVIPLAYLFLGAARRMFTRAV